MEAHVISHGKKWSVVKSGAKRASRNFEYREQAFHYAMGKFDKVVVHNKDASVEFIEYK